MSDTPNAEYVPSPEPIVTTPLLCHGGVPACPFCGYRCGCCCFHGCQTPCPTPDEDGNCSCDLSCHGGHEPWDCGDFSIRYDWARRKAEAALIAGAAMSDTTRCTFCEIVAGRAPATVLRETRDTLVIVPLNPVTDGHVLVIPKWHVVDALEDPRITAEVMHTAAEVATRPCNIITSAGAVATQTVFHLHVHVVPRRENDGLALPWTAGGSDE